jgi:simple sugar transport system permease protein
MAGENPIEVYQILIQGGFGSMEGIGYSLFYATPFIFAGLAVMIPYRAGLFNIGAEGQLYMGAVGLVAADRLLPDLGFLSPIFSLLFAGVFGGLWAGVAGALKAFRGAHEVITTIMMNFIAMSFSSYAILYWWKDPQSQRPETFEIRSSSWLPQLGLGDSPLNLSFLLAVLAVVLVWAFLHKTSFGFRLRAVGLSPSASTMAGYSVKSSLWISMFLGGFMAAGAAVNEILGNSHRFLDGFSAGYGFVGIAVAFLGRNHPFGILIAGVFFGALFKGASDLEIETHFITREFSVVLQALIIASVAAELGIKKWIEAWRFKFNRGN